MHKGITFGLMLTIAGTHLATKQTGILEYFDKALQQPEFVLPVSAYNRIAAQYFLPGTAHAQYPEPLLDTGIIEQIIRVAHATYATLPKQQWLNNHIPTFEQGKINGYIQKISLPQGSRILFFGDLHGSMQAFVRILCKLIALGYLDHNLQLQENTYIVFLGDFVDYGHNGMDTFCTALCLRSINPSRVFLCRGNHEDRQLNEDNSRGSFAQEIAARYPSQAKQLLDQAYNFYENLPSAIFLGIKEYPEAGFAQCCHGGLSQESMHEVAQLLTHNTIQYAALPNNAFFLIGGTCATNFNWGDFTGNPQAPDAGLSTRDGKRGFFKVFSMKGAQKIMHQLNIHALFRGHQDQFDCCKFLARGITEPIYPFSSALEMIMPPRRTFLTGLQDIIKHLIPNPSALFEQGFLLNELPCDNNGWIIAPIFTFSNATAPRMNDSEGCGILTLGTSWQTSRLQAYVATTPTMHFRHALIGNVDVAALANTVFSDETEQRTAIAHTDDFVQAFRAFLLIPSITHIDTQGNSLVFAHDAQRYTAALLHRRKFSEQLAATFGMPSNITPGIAPAFALKN